MNSISALGVFVSIAVLTVLAGLPWGLPTEDRFFLPLLPVVAIHFWALRRPERLPEWFVFLAGFLLDVVTHGPLGYWPLVYLMAYALGVLGAEAGRASVFARLALFAVSLVVVTVLSWAIASVYYLEPLDWIPYGRGAAFAALSALVVVPILHLLDVPSGEREVSQLTRGA